MHGQCGRGKLASRRALWKSRISHMEYGIPQVKRKILSNSLMAGVGSSPGRAWRGLYHSSLPWNHDRMIELSVADRAITSRPRGLRLTIAGDVDPDK